MLIVTLGTWRNLATRPRAIATTHANEPPSASTPGATGVPAGRTLSVVDVGSGTETAFTIPLRASGFDFSLDGSMVPYTDSDRNGNEQVFVMDASGSHRRQLTHGGLGLTIMGSPPQWSPDGSRIAY